MQGANLTAHFDEFPEDDFARTYDNFLVSEATALFSKTKKLLINPPSPPFVQEGIFATPPLPKGAAQRAGGF
jgi:hypothetical protein